MLIHLSRVTYYLNQGAGTGAGSFVSTTSSLYKFADLPMEVWQMRSAELEPPDWQFKSLFQSSPLLLYTNSHQSPLLTGTPIFLCAFEKVPSQSHLSCAAVTLAESAGIKAGAGKGGRERKVIF